MFPVVHSWRGLFAELTLNDFFTEHVYRRTTSVAGLWHKDHSRRERQGLHVGAELCCDVWFGQRDWRCSRFHWAWWTGLEAERVWTCAVEGHRAAGDSYREQQKEDNGVQWLNALTLKYANIMALFSTASVMFSCGLWGGQSLTDLYPGLVLLHSPNMKVLRSFGDSRSPWGGSVEDDGGKNDLLVLSDHLPSECPI